MLGTSPIMFCSPHPVGILTWHILCYSSLLSGCWDSLVEQQTNPHQIAQVVQGGCHHVPGQVEPSPAAVRHSVCRQFQFFHLNLLPSGLLEALELRLDLLNRDSFRLHLERRHQSIQRSVFEILRALAIQWTFSYTCLHCDIHWVQLEWSVRFSANLREGDLLPSWPRPPRISQSCQKDQRRLLGWEWTILSVQPVRLLLWQATTYY